MRKSTVMYTSVVELDRQITEGQKEGRRSQITTYKL